MVPRVRSYVGTFFEFTRTDHLVVESCPSQSRAQSVLTNRNLRYDDDMFGGINSGRLSVVGRCRSPLLPGGAIIMLFGDG